MSRTAPITHQPITIKPLVKALRFQLYRMRLRATLARQEAEHAAQAQVESSATKIMAGVSLG